ncbi:MAG TPA: hypothetical protein VKE74_28930 [Gemmataceae bacterium]|nr:hypothetical protein [Gemmataceae bacterium]
MATIEHDRETDNRHRVAWLVLGGLLVAGVLVAVIAAFGRPPQMGADEDVFRTVDALYTAVRTKDEARVAQCETRLHSYRDAGKLPRESADYLDGVIAKAREGRWESAAERLYEFMLAQRREGRPSAPPEKHRPDAKAGKK